MHWGPAFEEGKAAAAYARWDAGLLKLVASSAVQEALRSLRRGQIWGWEKEGTQGALWIRAGGKRQWAPQMIQESEPSCISNVLCDGWFGFNPAPGHLQRTAKCTQSLCWKIWSSFLGNPQSTVVFLPSTGTEAAFRCVRPVVDSCRVPCCEALWETQMTGCFLVLLCLCTIAWCAAPFLKKKCCRGWILLQKRLQQDRHGFYEDSVTKQAFAPCKWILLWLYFQMGNRVAEYRLADNMGRKTSWVSSSHQRLRY